MQTDIFIPTKKQASRLLGQIARFLIKKTDPKAGHDYSAFVIVDKKQIHWPKTLERLTGFFSQMPDELIESIGAINLYTQDTEEPELFDMVQFTAGLMEEWGVKTYWPKD